MRHGRLIITPDGTVKEEDGVTDPLCKMSAKLDVYLEEVMVIYYKENYIENCVSAVLRN